MEEWICQLCHWVVWSKEHYVCHCIVWHKREIWPVTKGIACPLYIASDWRLPKHHMFPCVVGPYGFVLVPRITGSPTIIPLLNPLKLANDRSLRLFQYKLITSNLHNQSWPQQYEGVPIDCTIAICLHDLHPLLFEKPRPLPSDREVASLALKTSSSRINPCGRSCIGRNLNPSNVRVKVLVQEIMWYIHNICLSLLFSKMQSFVMFQRPFQSIKAC